MEVSSELFSVTREGGTCVLTAELSDLGPAFRLTDGLRIRSRKTGAVLSFGEVRVQRNREGEVEAWTMTPRPGQQPVRIRVVLLND